MKHVLIIPVIILVCTYVCKSQDYHVNFTAYGITSVLDSVQVTNIQQNKNITVLGTDILHLVKDPVNIKTDSPDNATLTIYPNPADNYVNIEFYSNRNVSGKLQLFGISGKILFFETVNISEGKNIIKLSGLGKGMHFVKLNFPGKQFSGSFVSKSNNVGKISLENTFFDSPDLLQTKSLGNTRSVVPWQYDEEDLLLFKGFSDGHSRIYVYYVVADVTIHFNFVLCQDSDGNKYSVVSMGSQTFMAENLRTSKYNNNIPIPNIQDNSEWADLSTGGRCYYLNDSTTYAMSYGALYNFHAVSTGDLCPFGWRVPTKEEFATLLVYLQNHGYNYDGSVDSDNDYTTNDKTAKALSFTSMWISNSEPGCPGNSDYPNYRNRTGFSAIPSGMRNHTIGNTTLSGIMFTIWSSTIINEFNSYSLQIVNSQSKSTIGSGGPKYGLAIRCIKD